MAFFGRSRSAGSFLAAAGATVRPLRPAGPALALRRRVSSLRSSPPFDTRRLYSQGVGTALSATNKQVYTIPTYDAAFKWVLNNDDVRCSFFNAFIPNVVIHSSLRIDDNMNPVQKLQLLRQFLHGKSTSDAVKSLSSPGAYVVRDPAVGNGPPIRDESATSFLNGIVGQFEDIKGSFPRPLYDGKMDFACLLSTGEYALVEMQVVSEDHWDRRALAYLSAFYGNQLSKGGKWKDLRKVIGVNILGGGSQNKVAWPDAPDQFMRHYKFEDQLNGKGRFIDGIELFQYSIMNAPTVDDQGMKDWITFFRRAHFMNEEEVAAEIKTPAVLRAFELAKISKLPAQVRASYQADDDDFDRYSQHTAEQISKATKTAKMDGKLEGKHEGKLEVAQMMMKIGRPLNEIQEYTGLSSAEMEVIKSMGS